MTYIIYKDGIEENRIVADEDFCERYYSHDGYSYEKEPPAPAPEPEPYVPTTEERLAAVESAMLAMMIGG